VTRKQDGAAVSDIPILNKNRHPWLLRWQETEHQFYTDTDTVWNNTAPPGRHRQKPAHRMHSIFLHLKMLLSHMCQCPANLCKWRSAPSPSGSRHTTDHKSVTSRNSWTWRPISHFITTRQAPSQLQYIVSSIRARFQRVFQCVVGSFWKQMTTGVTTYTTWTFKA